VRRIASANVLALLAVVVLAATALAVSTTEVITDPFTNSTSQHATAVEPDTFAFGTTIVAAAQVGRFFDGGASGIGVATSTNAGSTWAQTVLPGITTHDANAGTFDRVSDPAVAYDAAHGVWLVVSLPILPDISSPAVLVSRSTDGGLTWGNPVTVTTAAAGQDFDKTWIVCDNTASSPFFGHCYVTFDDFGAGDLLLTSTSADGGLSWGTPKQTANRAKGLGGQPVVQPNGTVIVPAANAFETAIIAYRSTDGGASWSKSVTIAHVRSHDEAGNLRSGPLPSAEIDGAGNVYVVWGDCRFVRGCKANDIVMSTSSDGLTWTGPVRIPIDDTTPAVDDHFIPGIAVDRSTSGATAKLGLTYYFYDDTKCGSSCQLNVGYVQSNDGGATWSTNHVLIAGPFAVSLISDTSQGRMVGDYISTSWAGGSAFGAFSVAVTPSGADFDQGIYVPTGGVVATGSLTATVNRLQPEIAAASDHPDPIRPLRIR
jgi:hypothetical protein